MWTAAVYALLSPRLHGSAYGQSLEEALVTRSTYAVHSPAALHSVANSEWTWNRRTLKDWILSDIAIVATLDGTLHALERNSGEMRWTIASADSSVKASHTQPNNRSLDTPLDTIRDTWIVEPIDDGRLYTFNTRDGLRKLPFGIKQLVENSPFTVPGDDKVYVGERRTTLYSVDPRSGNVLQAYGTGFGHTSSTAPKCPTRDPLDELDDDTECIAVDPNAKDVLKIGRNTYMLTIFSGSETLWNVTYTEWVPNSVDTDLEHQYAGTIDGTYISPLYDGKIIAHQTETNDAIWFKDLSAPAVRVYDVLQMVENSDRGYKSDVSAVAIVAQPLDPHFGEIDHENYVDGDGSTYIGKTEDGDWFALSASKCPLVSRAPLSRWSAGTGQGTVEDLLGMHTHNRVIDKQTVSPGHLLTIEDTSTVQVPLIAHDTMMKSSSSATAWIATLLVLLLGVVGLGRYIWKTGSFFHAVKNNQPVPQVRLSDTKLNFPDTNEPNDLEVTEAAASVSSPPLVQDLRNQSDVTAVETQEPTKPKRKRGARSGKKARNAMGKSNIGEEQDEGVEADLPDNATEPKVIKAIPAQPLSSIDSSFPLKINALLVTDKILGYGSHGTIVYKGSFEGRDVAVKRMLLDFYDIASHEVVLLQESDDHPNVIRYYCKQENERFLYIALELCSASLAEVTERPSEFPLLVDCMHDVVSVLQQMALGIQYLHSLKIVHRDLKPQNILVNLPRRSALSKRTPDCARLVISDFGLCKKLDADQSSFRATTAHAAGTSGWRAPELLLDEFPDGPKPVQESSTSGSVDLSNISGLPRKVSRAIDVFSLGCVFYYVLSNGAHPFGERYMREANIIRNKSNLDHLEILGDLGVLARDLIARMLQPVPKDRPDATTVLQHPFFWSAERRLSFLLDISDRFEIEERDPPSPLLLMLESRSAEVVHGNWYARLDKNFIENLGRYRKYNGASILDLLRALRNKKHHYQDLPENVQNALGSLPGGFLNYFCSRFPLLLLHTYYLAMAELSHEAIFSPYFT